MTINDHYMTFNDMREILLDLNKSFYFVSF